MAKRGQFIYAVAVDRRILMERFHVNASSVSDALRFKGRNLRQRRIRSYAVNMLDCVPMNVQLWEPNCKSKK